VVGFSVSCWKLATVELQIFHRKDASCEVQRFQSILAPLKLQPYLYTKRVILSPTERSHSHPILTIHESHIDQSLLPAVFIHEQMHWRLASDQEHAASILSAIKKTFLSSGKLDAVHVAVCRLEVRALQAILGEAATKDVLSNAARNRKEYELAFSNGELVDSCLLGLTPSNERDK